MMKNNHERIINMTDREYEAMDLSFDFGDDPRDIALVLLDARDALAAAVKRAEAAEAELKIWRGCFAPSGKLTL